jgi:hypothetical protein
VIVVETDPDLLIAQLVALSEALVAMNTLVEETESPVLIAQHHSAKAAANALFVMIEAWDLGSVPGDEDDEDGQRPATKDPETCGHPQHFNLPGQTMCASCGASQFEDRSWGVW